MSCLRLFQTEIFCMESNKNHAIMRVIGRKIGLFINRVGKFDLMTSACVHQGKVDHTSGSKENYQGTGKASQSEN